MTNFLYEDLENLKTCEEYGNHYKDYVSNILMLTNICCDVDVATVLTIHLQCMVLLEYKPVTSQGF